MDGGRVGCPGETGDPAEGPGGWEAPGFPRDAPSGSNRSEDEVWATGGPGDADGPVDRFVLKSHCRSWTMGLAGDADGGPGQELQLTGTSVSPRGFRVALARSPGGESCCFSSGGNRESGQEGSVQTGRQGTVSQLTSPSWQMHRVQGSSSKVNT